MLTAANPYCISMQSAGYPSRWKRSISAVATHTPPALP